MEASPHANFFSSLKQVERRIASEDKSKENPIPQIHSFPPSSEYDTGFSSVIHIQYPAETLIPQGGSQSQPPLEFLSDNSPLPNNSIDFSNHQETIGVEKEGGEFNGDDDEIWELCELLGLGKDGLYSEEIDCWGISGAKMKRLNGWVKCLMKDGFENEELRLGHLMVAKAVALSGGACELEFPDSVEELLLQDPPQSDP
ncbi:hypothetical protein AMTRI_Chr12g267850 [Amborella trichopoda]